MKRLLLLATLLTVALPTWAARYVGSCGSPSYSTIQAAVNAIPSGGSDTVILCDGTYTESVQVNSKSVSFRSASNDKTKVTWNVPSGSTNGAIWDNGTWDANYTIQVEQITFANTNDNTPVINLQKKWRAHLFRDIAITTPRLAIAADRGLGSIERVSITITGSPSSSCSATENSNSRQEAAINFSANFDATIRDVTITNQAGAQGCEGFHIWKTDDRKSILFERVTIAPTKARGIHIVDAGKVDIKSVTAASTDAEAIRLEANVGKDMSSNYVYPPYFENITARGYNSAIYSFNGAWKATGLNLVTTKSSNCRNDATGTDGDVKADFALVLGNRWATVVEGGNNTIQSGCGGVKILQTNNNPRQNVTLSDITITSKTHGVWLDDGGKAILRKLNIDNQSDATGRAIYFSSRVGSGSDGRPENAANGNGPELNDITIRTGGSGIYADCGISKIETTSIVSTVATVPSNTDCTQNFEPVGIYFKPYMDVYLQNGVNVTTNGALPLLLCQEPNTRNVTIRQTSLSTQRAPYAAILALSTNNSYTIDGICATGGTDAGLWVQYKANSVTVRNSSLSGGNVGLKLEANNPTSVNFDGGNAFFGSAPINSLPNGRSYTFRNNFYEGHNPSQPYVNGQYTDPTPAKNPPLLANCPTGCSRITMFTAAPAVSVDASLGVAPHYQRQAEGALPADSYDLWGLSYFSSASSIARAPVWRTEAQTSAGDRSGKLRQGSSLSVIGETALIDPRPTSVRPFGPNGSFFGRFSHPVMQPLILGAGSNRFAVIPNDDGMLYTVRLSTGDLIAAWMPSYWAEASRHNASPPDGLWQKDPHAMTGGIAAAPLPSGGYLVAGTGARGRLHYAVRLTSDGTFAEALKERYVADQFSPTYGAPVIHAAGDNTTVVFVEGDEAAFRGRLVTWTYGSGSIAEAVTNLSFAPTSDLLDDSAWLTCSGSATLLFAGREGGNYRLYQATVAGGSASVSTLLTLPSQVTAAHAPVRYLMSDTTSSGKRFVALVGSDALTDARAADNRNDFLLVYEITGSNGCSAGNWNPAFFATMNDAGRWVSGAYQSNPCDGPPCENGVEKIGGRITGVPTIWNDTLLLPVSVGFSETQCTAAAYLYPYRLDDAAKLGAISEKQFTVTYRNASGSDIISTYSKTNIPLGSSGPAYSVAKINDGGKVKLAAGSGAGPSIVTAAVNNNAKKRLMWREIILE